MSQKCLRSPPLLLPYLQYLLLLLPPQPCFSLCLVFLITGKWFLVCLIFRPTYVMVDMKLASQRASYHQGLESRSSNRVARAREQRICSSAHWRDADAVSLFAKRRVSVVPSLIPEMRLETSLETSFAQSRAAPGAANAYSSLSIWTNLP